MAREMAPEAKIDPDALEEAAEIVVYRDETAPSAERPTDDSAWPVAPDHAA